MRLQTVTRLTDTLLDIYVVAELCHRGVSLRAFDGTLTCVYSRLNDISASETMLLVRVACCLR